MDEKVERADGGQARDAPGHADVLSAEHLAARVAVLRAQVRALVPKDHSLPRQAGGPTDEIRGSLERITALEQLLRQAHEREDRLTVQAIRDQATFAELRTRNHELEGLREAGAVTETARAAAEARAAEAERRLALVEAELRARLTELSRLRSRCEGFEKDLDALADEAATAAAGAARATRLEKERDEAMERAATERQLAEQDRGRAEEAVELASRLQAELDAAQRQLVNVTELNRRIEAVRESPKVLEPVGTPSPWVELQHLASATADDPAGEDSDASETEVEVEGSADAAIVDLTEAEQAAEEDDSDGPVVSVADEPPSSGAVPIPAGGATRRFWRRRRSTLKPGGQPPSSAP
jgi:chromosome segregation ATPase